MLFLLFFSVTCYLNLIQHSLWGVVLQFFVKKYITILLGAVFRFGSNSVLILLLSAKKFLYGIKLYTSLNVGLLNNYLYIHPTLLYSYLTIGALYIYKSNSFFKLYKKRFFSPLGLIILTNLFGLCWAKGEVLWNGPWSWDEIEVSLVALLLVTVYFFHKGPTSRFLNMLGFIIIYIFLMPKFDNVISPHQFSKNNFSQTPYGVKIFLISWLLLLIRSNYFKQPRPVLLFLLFITIGYISFDLKYWAIFLWFFLIFFYNYFLYFFFTPLPGLPFFFLIGSLSSKIPTPIFLVHKVGFFIILVFGCDLFYSFIENQLYLIDLKNCHTAWGLYYSGFDRVYLQNYRWSEVVFL